MLIFFPFYETIFIALGELVFHPIITGFILSAILAAVMSTISSQLLVTTERFDEFTAKMKE